jgi:predicted DNA-binding transcriptional regulator AlpA
LGEAFDRIAARPVPAAPGELADAIEPLLSIDALARVLNASRRSIERLRSAGKLPRPDLRIGKMPRWRPETIRRWIEGGGR